jgi:hypothetical protein
VYGLRLFGAQFTLKGRCDRAAKSALIPEGQADSMLIQQVPHFLEASSRNRHMLGTVFAAEDNSRLVPC